MSEVSEGDGQSLNALEIPLTHRMDERNVPSAVIELLDGNRTLGTWLVSPFLDVPQRVDIAGKTFGITLRFVRYYEPFTLELVDFRHDRYHGTDIPRNFSSRVRLHHASRGEEREITIRMNHPLRYGGKTFYQGGFDPTDDRITILQVVRNPGWLGPYVSSALVALGMMIQFSVRLISALRKW